MKISLRAANFAWWSVQQRFARHVFSYWGPMDNKVAVVGAGLSGIAALKELKEVGMDVVCYEQGVDIGGVFAEGGCYDSVELTVSNYFMAYSDFMPYDEEIKFWKRSEYKQYLDKYAEKFELRPHIKFGFTLKKLQRINDRIWELEFENVSTGELKRETVNKVAICSGQFQKPNIPEIPGLDNFDGPIVHSSTYTNTDALAQFHDKRVLCFGMGESAADIIAEVASVAKRTILSLRRHHMFSSRYLSREKNQHGYNTIDVLQSRFYHCLPVNEKTKKVRDVALDAVNHSVGGPRQLMAEHVLNAGDEPGSVVTKTERIFDAQNKYDFTIDVSGLDKLEQGEAHFHSGKVEPFDAILFCTGFMFDLPYLSQDVKFSNIRESYLHMFHPNFGENLAFIGFVRPQQGGVPLMAELQSRYFAQCCIGNKKIPENYAELAKQDSEAWEKEFYETPMVAGLVNGLRYNEQLAALIGCQPPRPSLFAHPRKYFCYWFNHIWPCQYRLTGPGSRQEARDNWCKAPSVTNRFQNLRQLLVMLWLKLRSFFDSNEKNKWRAVAMESSTK